MPLLMFSRYFLSLLIRTCQILTSFSLKHILVILKRALMYAAYRKSHSKTSLKALTLIKLMFLQHRLPAFIPSCNFISCLWRGCHLTHVPSFVAVSRADTALQQGLGHTKPSAGKPCAESGSLRSWRCPGCDRCSWPG